MIEKILFYGGINSDDEDRFLPDGDYRYALNIRNSKGDKNSQGAIENTKGNTLVSFNLPSGLNKCIGGKYDEVNNRVIYFIWNLLSNHSIIKYDVGTGSVTSLMQSSVLNFNKDYPILSIEIIDNLIYWTDEYNPPRKINLTTAENGGYTTIDEQVISAVQYAPNYSPSVQYGTDNTVNYNKVRSKVFQFKYAFVYDDNEVSAYSPVSKVAIPPNQAIYDFGGYYEPSLDNFISVEINTGNYLCKRIKIVAREGNIGDWYLVKDLDKSELNISDNSTHTYNFYNDEVYVVVTQAEINRLFDYVPLIAGAQSMVDGNRLTYSDITEGYDNIDISGNTVITIYNDYPEQITSKVKGFGAVSNPSFSNTAYANTGLIVLYDQSVIASGNVSAGTVSMLIDATNTKPTDVWNITPFVQLNKTYAPGSTVISLKDDFVATFAQGDSSQTIADYFANEINNSNKLNGTFNINVDIFNQISINTSATTSLYSGNIWSLTIHYSIDISYSSPFPYAVTSSTSYQSVISSVFADISTNYITKTFKRNSRYSFSLLYFDDANRSGVCQVTDSFDVFVKPYSQTPGKGSVEMNINIFNTPPAWAKYYQILFTDNRSIGTYIQTDSGGAVVQGTTVKIYINTLSVYNALTGGKSSLSYTWTKGDRVTFIKDFQDNFFSDFYDLEIISSDSDSTGQYIVVDNVIPISFTNGVLMELYTPKLNQENVFYWEVGEVYPVIGGYHAGNIQQVQTSSQSAIINIKGGDSYFRFRSYNINSFIEDYSLSDYYSSKAWDKGRFNIVDKEYKQIRRYATTYYSEQFIPDTNINGLSVFYDTNFHEANKNYGAIQRTYAEQDRLLFFQEKRTGFSLVNKNVLYNSDGTPNGVVGQASQVLSDVQYYAQDYGIGDNPESLTVNGTRKYHVDPYKGYVLRLSIDGYTEISEYKCHVLFQDIFNQRKKFTENNRGKIWGVYDRRVDEYVLSFESCSEPPQVIFNKEGIQVISGFTFIQPFTLSFSEEKKRWVTYYSYNPDFMMSNGIDILTWENGMLYTHNTNSVYNNFYGDQYNTVVRTVTNQDPSNVKNFISMFEESTDVWSMTATTPGGQATSLEVGDFEINEGVWYSALLKDSNTPNVLIPLIEGDDMRDASMTIELTNNNTTFTKLFAINVRYVYSEMTNK